MHAGSQKCCLHLTKKVKYNNIVCFNSNHVTVNCTLAHTQTHTHTWNTECIKILNTTYELINNANANQFHYHLIATIQNLSINFKNIAMCLSLIKPDENRRCTAILICNINI